MELMVITESLPANGNSFTKWRAEQSALQNSIRQTRDWLGAALCCESPSCPELIERVQGMATQLQSHFQLSGEIYDSLGESLWCIEVDSAKRQTQLDQQHLLDRLNLLVTTLQGAAPTPASFEAAADQLEWVFDELDLHEEREADSFDWLRHSRC